MEGVASNGQQQPATNLGYQVKSPIIETLGVSKAYQVGDQMISPVSDISLQIGYGEFAVIVGPSGAGKTSLLNILMGLERPDIGEVFLKNASLYDYTDEQRSVIRRKRISYLPNTQYWLENMNVVDNVALPLILQGVPPRKARQQAVVKLASVGLQDRLKLRPTDLSSGQQQKAALARALIKEPWIIFADEPTAHLDTKSVEEVTNLLLTAVKQYQTTLIMVTHDLEYLKIASRWFFMRDGRLWDIKDRKSPFTDIKEALSYIDTIEQERAQQ